MEQEQTGTMPSWATEQRIVREDVSQWPISARLRRRANILIPFSWRCWHQTATRRAKAGLVFGHSTLEGIYTYSLHWRAWMEANPGHPLCEKRLFSPRFQARAEFRRDPLLTRERTAVLAAAWDSVKDRLTCGVCWQRSAARRILDYAVADAMGYSRASMDEAAAQVSAARVFFDTLSGEPPGSVCELPGVCPQPEAFTPAADGPAADIICAAAAR